MTHLKAGPFPVGEPMSTSSSTRPFLGLLYLAGAALVIDQGLILASSILPFSPGAAQWRFGAVGLAAGRITPLLVADTAIILAAVWLGHRAMLRVWAILHLALVVVILLGLGGFALDTIQVRQLLVPEAQPGMLLGASRVGIMLLAMVVWTLWAGLRLLHVLRATKPPSQGRRSLIVGQREPTVAEPRP